MKQLEHLELTKQFPPLNSPAQLKKKVRTQVECEKLRGYASFTLDHYYSILQQLAKPLCD